MITFSGNFSNSNNVATIWKAYFFFLVFNQMQNDDPIFQQYIAPVHKFKIICNFFEKRKELTGMACIQARSLSCWKYMGNSYPNLENVSEVWSEIEQSVAGNLYDDYPKTVCGLKS